MGSFNETTIADDEVLDFLDGIFQRLGTLACIQLAEEDESLDFCSLSSIASSDVYTELREAFSKYHDELLKVDRVIYEDKYLFAIAAIYMCMGAPISDSFKSGSIYAIDHVNLSVWKNPKRKKAFLESLKKALLSYDNITPLFEVEEIEWVTPDSITGVDWVTLDALSDQTKHSASST